MAQPQPAGASSGPPPDRTDRQTVYVRVIAHDEHRLYAIHGSDGRPLALASSRELALASARIHDFMPVDAH